MSFTVDVSFATKFADDFHALAQQTVSRLEGYVRRRPGTIVGEAFTVETIGTTEAEVNPSRHSDIVYADMTHARRYADMRDLRAAELFDSLDKLKLAADPMSYYNTNLIAAVNRGKDKAIIDALLGGVRTTSGTSALPAGQIISSGTTGMSLTKLIQAKELLDGAEMDDSAFFQRMGMAQTKEDPYGNLMNPSYVLIVGVKQMTNLLSDSTVRDVDANSIKALVSGSLNTYMGFRFIRVPDALLPKSGNDRQCIAYAPRAIEYGVGLDTSASIKEIAHKDGWQILAKASIGAARAEDAGVIRIDCTE